MASTRSRPPVSASTLKDQSTDDANDSRDRLLLGGAAADGAEARVGLDEQDLRAHAIEAHESRVAELVAVEADGIGADAGGERDLVDQLLARAAGSRGGSCRPSRPSAAEGSRPGSGASPSGPRSNRRRRRRGPAPETERAGAEGRGVAALAQPARTRRRGQRVRRMARQSSRRHHGAQGGLA